MWDVPTAVWLYGFLRGGAFTVPALTGAGTFGIGALVILPLYVLLVRRSQIAWMALLILDVLAFTLLVLATRIGETPLLVHILSGLALITLLLPSIRRYVSRRDKAGRLL